MLSPSTPTRRLEDRIRVLCARAIDEKGEEWKPLLEELKTALHEHSERMRQMLGRNLPVNKRTKATPK